jgi:hypothetical protein
MTWDAATPLMLAKLHREIARRVDQGAVVCAEGVTSTYWARRNRVHHVSNDGMSRTTGEQQHRCGMRCCSRSCSLKADELVWADALLDDPASSGRAARSVSSRSGSQDRRSSESANARIA